MVLQKRKKKIDLLACRLKAGLVHFKWVLCGSSHNVGMQIPSFLAYIASGNRPWGWNPATYCI